MKFCEKSLGDLPKLANHQLCSELKMIPYLYPYRKKLSHVVEMSLVHIILHNHIYIYI